MRNASLPADPNLRRPLPITTLLIGQTGSEELEARSRGCIRGASSLRLGGAKFSRNQVHLRQTPA